MGKYENLRNQNQQIGADMHTEAAHFSEIAAEDNRVANIYAHPAVILDDLDRQFSKATQLDGPDVAFLLLATALQCVRQYFLTSFKLPEERPGDKKAASDTWGHRETHSQRGIIYYDPSFSEILSNPVPFDAIRQDESIRGVFRGTGHFGHRTTLGHDPILGWVVGTANIATSTLTTWKLRSFHVKTDQSKRDIIIDKADTIDVFYHMAQKLICNEGRITEPSLIDGRLQDNNLDKIAGPAIIALSLLLEWEHLRSDIKSKKSLPVPVITSISPELAGALAKYGIDMCNIQTVVKQASYSMLINYLVAVIHRMLYDESDGLSQSMYEVKTRKILTYSNVIASASNVIAVAVTEAVAVHTGNKELAKKGMKYLDIGGLAVTLYRLISDYNFIKQVKLEFLEKQWYDIVLGDDYQFMKEEASQ